MQPSIVTGLSDTFTVAILILLLSVSVMQSSVTCTSFANYIHSVIFRCRMGDIHYISKLQLTSPQTLMHINGSTLILTYCPPMTKSHSSTKHGNRIGHEHHLNSGTPLNYTWTCPNGPCEVEGYYGRKVYNEHILAVQCTITLTKSFQIH